MGSQDGGAIDPPKAKLAARVAIASLSALAVYSLLGTFQHLGVVSVLSEGSSCLGAFVLLFSVAGYLFWLFRRHDSLPWIDALPDEGAGRVILWHFVPLANIVKPYEALREIWDATETEEEATGSFRAPVSMFWAAVLGTGALITLQLFTGRSMSEPALRILDAFVGLLFGAIGVSGVVMILQIESRWSRRYALLSARYAEPPADAPPDQVTTAAAPAPPGSWSSVGVPAPAVAAAVESSAAASYASATAVAVPDVSVAAERPPASTARRPSPLGPAELTALANLRSAGTVASILALLMGAQLLLMLVSGMSQGAVVLLYAAVGLLSAIPAIHLWGFSRAAAQFAGSPTEINLRNVLRSLGSFWAFIGGFVALVLILQVVLIGLGILAAVIAAAARS